MRPAWKGRDVQFDEGNDRLSADEIVLLEVARSTKGYRAALRLSETG